MRFLNRSIVMLLVSILSCITIVAAEFIVEPTTLFRYGNSLSNASYAGTMTGSTVATTGGIQSVPITNISPSSNLLAPGSDRVALTFNTMQPDECRYSVGSLLDFSSMQHFDSAPATAHSGDIRGLSPDPQVLNTVFIRCDSNPAYVQTLEYRAITAPSGSFPRIGSIWWGSHIYSTNPDLARKIKLYLAPAFTAEQARAVRALNPSVIIVNPNSNAVDTPGGPYPLIPDDFYLKDTKGNRIEIWPDDPPSYRLNLTKPEVAEFLAQHAYQKLVESHLAFDGIFFDNFFTSISWVKHDRFGNPIAIDANNDGQPDDPVALDAAWRKGVYDEINAFRKLAPYAYTSGHLGDGEHHPDTLAIFDGNSILSAVPDAREGLASFDFLFQSYQSWFGGKQRPITMLQSAPPNQLAYGYGYKPHQSMPPATATFAQSFYANVRFGLATSLMNNGYFVYDFGDSIAPVAWWYDEYDFNLGLPLGPAILLRPGQSANDNLIRNGGFESSLAGTWKLIVTGAQGQAALSLDSTTSPEGNSSAHITIAAVGTANWHIDFEQDNLPLVAGTSYEVKFWAKADVPRTITVHSQGGAPNFPNYGLDAQIAIDATWKLYTAFFTAPVSANDGRLQFFVGDRTGNVWIEDVTLSTAPLPIYRRDFTNGIVLLNGTSKTQSISLEPGFQRFSGTQAPRYQYIVDDADAGFSSNGAWNIVTYNTGSFRDGFGSILPFMPQNANGPHYHAWQGTCHTHDSLSGNAQWNLGIPADGQYSIKVWLPAAPNANTWTKNAIYEIVVGGNVIFSANIDQTAATAGDAWHTIAANIGLTASASPFLRLRNGASASLIADAVYVSSAALYNDGSAAPQVALAPMDGILLRRQQSVAPLAVVNSADFRPSVASGSIVSAFGQNLATASGGATGPTLPTSLFGTTIKVRDAGATVRDAQLFYVSPGQINYLIPEGTIIGPATVTITSGDGSVSMGIIYIDRVATALFTANADGNGVPAAVTLRVKADGSQLYEDVAQYNGAQWVPRQIDLGPPGELLYLVLFGTGIRNRTNLRAVTATIGGMPITLDASKYEYAGPAPGYVGLDQVTVLLPRDLIGRGELDLTITANGVTSNVVRIKIK